MRRVAEPIRTYSRSRHISAVPPTHSEPTHACAVPAAGRFHVQQEQEGGSTPTTTTTTELSTTGASEPTVSEGAPDVDDSAAPSVATAKFHSPCVRVSELLSVLSFLIRQ